MQTLVHSGPRWRAWGTMRRHIRGLGVLAAGVVALLATAPDAHATCRGRNFVDDLSLFVNGTARATSSNGQSYDRIESGSFDGDYRIVLCGDGALDGVIVHLGQCSGHGRGGCASNPIMYQEFPSARDLAKKMPSFSFAIPPDSGAGQSILATCNAHADEQKGAARDKEIFPGFFGVTLGVDTRRDTGRLGGGHSIGHVASGVADPANHRPLDEYSRTATGQLTLKVLCAPLPQPVKAPPKIVGAQLGVATFGDTCPKPAAATVMISAEAPRPVFYKIERGNGTTTTDDWIKGEIKLQKAPDGRQRPFLAAQHKLPVLDPGTRRFRLWIDGWGKTPWRTVEVDCPPFKVTSAWLKYEVENKETCPRRVEETATFKATRPGQAPFQIKTQGGLVVHSGTAKFEREGMGYVAKVQRPNLMMSAFDSDMMALIKTQPDANSGWVRLKVECLQALSGKVTLKSLGATSCQGEALIAIHTNGAGELPYELECGPGRSWQRKVEAMANRIGVDKVRFDVKNNERVTCTLRTRIGGKLKSLDGTTETFRCHRPTGVSGTDELVPETRPDARKPRLPDRVADPPRTCPRGTIGAYPDCRKAPVTVLPLKCPPGKVGRPPNCIRPLKIAPATKCPPGMVGRPPNCRARPCPRGQQRVRGRCVRPAG